MHPEHPIHGSPYVCSLNLSLYTYAGYDRDAADKLRRDHNALAAAGKPHAHLQFGWWDKNFYMIDEPGDDKFDVDFGLHRGVCTDIHIAYGHTGCTDSSAARFTIAANGCSGRAFGWATSFCGALIEHDDSDFVTDVGISESSLRFPRTLVPETQVNGKTELSITCSDGIECQKKCEFFAQTSRDNGLPVRN